MGFVERLRRPNWLEELQGLLVAGLVLAGIIGAIVIVDLARRRSVEMTVDASGVTGTVDDGLPAGATIDSSQSVQVVVEDPDTGQWVSFILAGALTPVLMVVFIALLLRIVRQARRDDPLSAAIARQLRLLAVVALVGGVAVNVVELLATLHLTGTVSHPQVVWQPPVLWILVGFVTFTVAEVIRRGNELREELETVV